MSNTIMNVTDRDGYGSTRTVKVLLGIQAILISIIIGLIAGILTVASGMLIITAVTAGGGTFLVAVPVVLGTQRAITD